MTAPALSTVRMPLRELGRLGFRHARARSPADPNAPDRLPTDLVLRGSTGRRRSLPRPDLAHGSHRMSLNLRGIIPPA